MPRRLVKCSPVVTLLCGVLGISLACTDPEPTPTLAVSLSSASASVQQGASGTLTITLTRTNFTGAATLSVEGLPAGVTASFSANPTTGNTSTLTLIAEAGVPVGAMPITIRCRSTLADVTSTFSLAITAAPPVGNFSLSTPPVPLSITRGGDPATTFIAITRTGGFSASVSLAVTGAPSGLTATLDQASTTGDIATLTVKAVASVAAQQYTLTITGTATNLPSQSITLQIVVSAPAPTGNVSLDYSGCDGPVWLAAQDGDGPWSQVVGVHGVYRFNITSGKGGYATAWNGDYSGRGFYVTYGTQAELVASSGVVCNYSNNTKRVNGAVSGLTAPTDAAMVSMGGAAAGPLGYFTNTFTLWNVSNGSQDLVAYRYVTGGPSPNDRAIILRDQDIPANGFVGVDFGGSGVFAPVSAALSVAGAIGGDLISPSMQYATGATCIPGSLYDVAAGSATAFTLYGIPAAQQRASDFHVLWLDVVNGPASGRSVGESFHSMTDRTITLGAPLPTPTLTSLPAPYKRLQATVAIPSEYHTSATFAYSSDAGWGGEISATSGWLGGSSTLAMPDFTTVGGWQNDLLPPASATVQWTFLANGSNLTGGTFCTEGASIRSAHIAGIY